MRLVLISLIALSLCSCGTKKVHSETESHTQIKQVSTDSITRNDSIWQHISTLMKEKLFGTIKLTEWTTPDSNGIQHKAKEVEMTFTYDSEADTQKVVHKVSQTTAIHDEQQQINHQSSSSESIRQDTRVIPQWVWWFLIVGGVIAAIIAWLTRKKT